MSAQSCCIQAGKGALWSILQSLGSLDWIYLCFDFSTVVLCITIDNLEASGSRSRIIPQQASISLHFFQVLPVSLWFSKWVQYTGLIDLTMCNWKSFDTMKRYWQEPLQLVSVVSLEGSSNISMSHPVKLHFVLSFVQPRASSTFQSQPMNSMAALCKFTQSSQALGVSWLSNRSHLNCQSRSLWFAQSVTPEMRKIGEASKNPTAFRLECSV